MFRRRNTAILAELDPELAARKAQVEADLIQSQKNLETAQYAAGLFKEISVELIKIPDYELQMTGTHQGEQFSFYVRATGSQKEE